MTIERSAKRREERSTVTTDPWEKEQIKALVAEQRRRDACQRRARRAAVALLKATAEEGPSRLALGYALATVREVARDLDLTEVRTSPKSRRKQIGRAVTRQVWDRDGWECKRCGGHADLTVDHITPVVAGGTNDLDNLQTMCRPCNSSKGARTV